MKYDLIIVAHSKNERLQRMTQNCINSAKGPDVKVILIETFKLFDYDNVDVLLEYNGQFFYNKALNIGLDVANCDIQILANNDIVFYEGWQTIGYDMINNGFDSASAWYEGSQFPQGDHVYEGYGIATHITGWCIFITKGAMNKIGRLNEDMEFWYSDNMYARQLRMHELRHGLFCNVRVDHLLNQTLNTMPMKIKRHYSQGQIAKYNTLCQERKYLQR